MKEVGKLNFTTVQVSNTKKIDSLFKKTLFLKKMQSKDLSVIHSKVFNNDLNHVVFNVEDEYMLSTTKLGHKFNFPYSSWINTFYKHSSKLMFIENEAYEFDKVIISELEKYLDLSVTKNNFSNSLYFKVFEEFKGIIKKCEYINKDDEPISLDFTKTEKFYEIINKEYQIDFLTLNFEGKLISIYKSGKVTIDNNDENHLLDVIERFYKCIG